MINQLAFLLFFQSNYLYTDNARKMRDKYKVVLDTPEYRKVQELKTHLSEVSVLCLSLWVNHIARYELNYSQWFSVPLVISFQAAAAARTLPLCPQLRSDRHV